MSGRIDVSRYGLRGQAFGDAGGRNLAESFCAAMPYLSWQTLIVGDPLCAPFPRQPLTADATDPSIDAATELPAEFSRRKLANIYPAISRSAVAAFMTFQSRALRGDTAGAWVATRKRRRPFEKHGRRRRLRARSPVACGDHLRRRRRYASGVGRTERGRHADPTLVNRAEIQKLPQQLAARKF
jgi:hypothetical protein